MSIIEGRTFGGQIDRGGSLYQDLELRRCRFVGCGLSVTRDVSQRSVVRNVILERCEDSGSIINNAIFDEVRVSGLKTGKLLQAWAAVFRHVTFEGKIGRIMLSASAVTGTATPSEQRAHDEANAKFYQGVDWALDLRAAEFEECDLERVPAGLVRRDPQTQVVVRRERALAGEWKKLDLSQTYWPVAIQFMLERGDPDVVLVAPRRHRKFRPLLDGLNALVDAGIAER